MVKSWSSRIAPYALVLGWIALVGVTQYAAAAPPLIHFQGYLTDSTSVAVEDDVYALRFRIYDDSIGGTILWESSGFVPLQTTNGLLNHLLGSTNTLPDSVFTVDDLWVGISIEAESEAVPRTRLVSVPFSMAVKSLDGASGGLIESDLLVSGMVSSLAGGFRFPDSSIQVTAVGPAFSPLDSTFRFNADLNGGGVSLTAPPDTALFVTSITGSAINVLEVRINGSLNFMLYPETGVYTWSCGGAPIALLPGESMTFVSHNQGSGWFQPVFVTGWRR